MAAVPRLTPLLCVALLAAAPAAATGQKDGGRRIRPFEGDWKAARAEALERNAPLVVLVMLEGEEASERCRRQMYASRELAQATQDLVLLVANNGLHERKKVVEEGVGGPLERELCALFLTPSCTEHQRHFDQAFQAYNEDGQLWAPQLIVALPDGAFSGRVSNRDVPPMGRVLETIERAREAAGPTLSPASLGEVRTRVLLARRAVQAQDAPGAWRAWLAVLELAPAGPHAREAHAGVESARETLGLALEAERARLVPGTAGAAWETLSELAERARGLSAERELRALLREAEAKRELREEIAAAKLEREARALLSEAEAFLAAGEERKAERTVQRLVRSKKLGATESARRACERWPSWCAQGGKGG